MGGSFMAKSKAKVDPDDKVFAEFKAYVRANPTPKGLTGMVNVRVLEQYGSRPRKLFPVASKRRIAKAEAALGFEIPSLLKRLYLEISNGVRGFKFDIYGLEGGLAGSTGTLVEQYFSLKGAFEDLGLDDEWEPGLLPFCDWGCAIYSCVDCSDPTFPISTWEDCELWPEDYTLRDFFKRWIKGKGRSDAEVEVVSKSIKNPFTGKKTTVYGQRRRRAK